MSNCCLVGRVDHPDGLLTKMSSDREGSSILVSSFLFDDLSKSSDVALESLLNNVTDGSKTDQTIPQFRVLSVIWSVNYDAVAATLTDHDFQTVKSLGDVPTPIYFLKPLLHTDVKDPSIL